MNDGVAFSCVWTGDEYLWKTKVTPELTPSEDMGQHLDAALKLSHGWRCWGCGCDFWCHRRAASSQRASHLHL